MKGRHERMLGRALKGRRDRAVVCTKFGNIAAAMNFLGGDGIHFDLEPSDIWENSPVHAGNTLAQELVENLPVPAPIPFESPLPLDLQPRDERVAQ